MNNQDSQLLFDQSTGEFIKFVEGESQIRAYKDISRKITISSGFNMDDSRVREIFNRAPKREKWMRMVIKLDFDKVYNKLQNITLNAKKLMLRHSLSIRLKEINHYRKIWDKLRPHEKLTIYPYIIIPQN
jgi:hypothetical protein